MSESINILIIDDNEDDRLLYRRTLQKSTELTYQFSEADDCEEGLKCIQENVPTCVLLDYSLPGQNGLEVLKRIRNKYPFIPVVMLTGMGNENVAVAAMQQGAQNYISKSNITLETLEHVIRMAIEHCALQKRIDEQRTSLEVFTRALAHDLNEPVRTIRTFIDLISQIDAFPEKAKDYFHYIRSAADRMHMLIDTVFLYTRLDDPGQMPREMCNITTIIQEAEENLAQLIQEHGAVIAYSDLPSVNANRIQVIQVLQNLISNAICHSEKPVAIHVSASPHTNNQWLFRVSDNGPGISEAYLQKIFLPFKRMTLHEEQGAGLGLAICKKIVEAHEGKIWCESKPGVGATFLFTLPMASPMIAETPRPPKAEAPASHVPAESKEQNNNRPLANILLVDDSRAFIEITQIELMVRAQLQCNFFIARSGEEALARLHDKTQGKGPIDLMLLDINMPEMDGFEVLEQMIAEKSLQKTSVVMCTGSIYDKDMERARALGAVGYLTKPIEFAKLKPVIEQAATIKLYQEGDGYTLLRAA